MKAKLQGLIEQTATRDNRIPDSLTAQQISFVYVSGEG